MTARADIAERNRMVIEIARTEGVGAAARRFRLSTQSVHNILHRDRKASKLADAIAAGGEAGAGASGGPSLSPLDLQIIALASQGKPPREIRAELPDANQTRVSNAIAAARKAGIAIPDFRPPPRPDGPSKASLRNREKSRKPPRAEAPSAPDPVAPDVMTAADDDRLTAYWNSGNCSVTKLAALMRKKYAVLEAAIIRLDLSRAPEVKVGRRVVT